MSIELPKMNHVFLNHTLYVIYLEIDQDVSVQIGKLGLFPFPKGIYLYVGSAKRNIRARINRHVRIEKPLRWHIDYLRPYGKIVKIETFSDEWTECQLVNKMYQESKGEVLVNGFGSSDCKCKSHLIYTVNSVKID